MEKRPMRRTRRLAIFAMAASATILTVRTASAQRVVFNDRQIEILGASDDPVMSLNDGGDIYLGGADVCGDITVYRYDDGATLRFNGWLGDLTLGGATGGNSQDGDIFLKNADGATTTVSIDGNLGLLELGAPGEDGDIEIFDDTGAQSFYVDGRTGNVTNDVGGNGLVKGWANINADGTIAACWRCDTNTSNTYKSSTGSYYVSFSPVGADITTRAAICSVGHLGRAGGLANATIDCSRSASYPERVYVSIEGAATQAQADRPFTVLLF